MTLKILKIAEGERKANAPETVRKPQRAHRGKRMKIARNGRERTPNVVPTDRDRREYDLLRPEEVERGYQVRWHEPPRE